MKCIYIYKYKCINLSVVTFDSTASTCQSFCWRIPYTKGQSISFGCFLKAVIK